MSNDPPPEGSSPDDWQDEEDEDDSYDWFLYRYAINALRSQEERDAVTAAALAVQRAARAGLVPARWGLGIFGGDKRDIRVPDTVLASEDPPDFVMINSAPLSFICQPCQPIASNSTAAQGPVPATEVSFDDGEEV